MSSIPTPVTPEVTPDVTEASTTVLASAAAQIAVTGLTGLIYRIVIAVIKDANVGHLGLRLNGAVAYSSQYVRVAAAVIDAARQTGFSRIQMTVDNQELNRAYTAEFWIAKPLAAQRAACVFDFGTVSTSGPNVQHALNGAMTNSLAALINEIDLIAATNNMAAGTAIVVEQVA